jgi:hypothetical protein
MTQQNNREELESSQKSSNRREAPHLLFILPKVQGLAPAQGSVKPTAGFTTIKFRRIFARAIVSLPAFLYSAAKSIVTLCARRIP